METKPVYLSVQKSAGVLEMCPLRVREYICIPLPPQITHEVRQRVCGLSEVAETGGGVHGDGEQVTWWLEMWEQGHFAISSACCPCSHHFQQRVFRQGAGHWGLCS